MRSEFSPDLGVGETPKGGDLANMLETYPFHGGWVLSWLPGRVAPAWREDEFVLPARRSGGGCRSLSAISPAGGGPPDGPSPSPPPRLSPPKGHDRGRDLPQGPPPEHPPRRLMQAAGGRDCELSLGPQTPRMREARSVLLRRGPRSPPVHAQPFSSRA